MTKIWNETGFVADDPWVVKLDGTETLANEKVLHSLEAFLEATGDKLGVFIQPGDDIRQLQPFLNRIALIAIVFPAFNDGRGFSHATLLRQHLGFTGEIRAIGDVLIDQVPLMLRCGFDSFSVSNAVALKRLGEGRLFGISNHYQPAARVSQDAHSYSWRRLTPA